MNVAQTCWKVSRQSSADMNLEFPRLALSAVLTVARLSGSFRTLAAAEKLYGGPGDSWRAAR